MGQYTSIIYEEQNMSHEPQVYKRECRDCGYQFETNDVMQDCPKCGGWTQSQPLFKSREEWAELMQWQG
jgi:predicted Zn-ribbon and HTH transcriptional regulator